MQKESVVDNALLGKIMHVDIFGQSFIILNSSKIARDLMEKRSSIYSDRPHFVGLYSSRILINLPNVSR